MSEAPASPLQFKLEAKLDVNELASQVAELIAYLVKNDQSHQGCVFDIVNTCGWQFVHQGRMTFQGGWVSLPGESGDEVIQWGPPNTPGYLAFCSRGDGMDGAISASFFSNGGKPPFIMFGACIRDVGHNLFTAYCGGQDIYSQARKTPGWIEPALQQPGVTPTGIAPTSWQTSSFQNPSVEVKGTFGTAHLTIKGDLGKVTTDNNRNLYNAKFFLSN